jgi:hypothetical protein
MGLFSRKPSMVAVDEYSFDPQPDITAYELAMILRQSSGPFFMMCDHQLPPEVARHFQFVRQTASAR